MAGYPTKRPVQGKFRGAALVEAEPSVWIGHAEMNMIDIWDVLETF